MTLPRKVQTFVSVVPLRIAAVATPNAPRRIIDLKSTKEEIEVTLILMDCLRFRGDAESDVPFVPI